MGRDIRLSCCVALAAAGALASQYEKIVEAVRNYDAGWAKIELLGVCKASETKAMCWDAIGKPAPKLEAEFKESFEYNDYRHIPLKLGRKTRVAVFKVTRTTSDDDQFGMNVNFQSNVGGDFDWSPRGQSDHREPVQFKTVTFVSKPAEKEGQALANLSHNFPTSEPLRCAEGESLNYRGTKFAIRKVGEAGSIPAHLGNTNNSRWVIAMTAEGRDKHADAYWTAIGHDGLAIQAVDPSGVPVFAPAGLPYVQPGQVDASGKPFVPQVLHATVTTGYAPRILAADDYILYTNIDPSKIKEIRARGVTSLRLTIKGIPLEPK